MIDKRFAPAFIILVLVAMVINTAGCSQPVPSAEAANLMEDVVAGGVEGKPSDDNFVENTADFSLELFTSSIAENRNSLVSPLSVQLALAMTANGADTETLSQMEAVLGGGIPLAELNDYLHSYVENLPSQDKTQLSIANSIWFRQGLAVDQDFLQTNADYYAAAAYQSAFDRQTILDINNWVEQKTNGMIDEILEEIASDAIMYLINAIAFEAEWEHEYNKEDIFQDEFTAHDGSNKQVDFMRSTEGKYIDDGQATGFIKPYANDDYSFVALLPNDNVGLQEYVGNLTGQQFLQTLDSASLTTVNATLPKFSYEYTVEMNDALKAMGMPIAFSEAEADFSKLGSYPNENIFIGDVLHKTFISVDELGTKAGAVTKVEMRVTGAPMAPKTVVLDRPFVYAIVDNATNLPIFIGTVLEIEN